MEQKKKKNSLKIILLIAGVISLATGIFWLGINFAKKKETSQVKTDHKSELEEKLQQLRNQLQNKNKVVKRRP